MTRQMADDGKPSLYEAIAVFDKSASRTTPNPQTEAWTVIRAAVAALQAERDALRKHSDQLAGERFSERNHTALQSRAERAESALEALRGQVAGLVEGWRTRVPADAPDSPRVVMREWCADELAELLAIKERMG